MLHPLLHGNSPDLTLLQPLRKFGLEEPDSDIGWSVAVAHPEEDSRSKVRGEGEDDWRNYIMSAVEEGLVGKWYTKRAPGGANGSMQQGLFDVQKGFPGHITPLPVIGPKKPEFFDVNMGRALYGR